jgi:RNA polymerase sigma-70 factor, ECF subfamily
MSGTRLLAFAGRPAVAVEAPPADRLVVSEADTASFHALRPRLFRIAYGILDSTVDADDVVQDAWIRWQSTDRTRVRDATGFLVTTTRRLAINATQSARARREVNSAPWLTEPADIAADPALDAERREALDLAVRSVLERLSCTERAAYVLREAFEYPYKRIARVLAVSETNARQLVTRARARISSDRRATATPGEQQAFLEAFVAAAQTGDLGRLERILTADLVARSAGGRTAPIRSVAPADDAHPPVAIAA